MLTTKIAAPKERDSILTAEKFEGFTVREIMKVNFLDRLVIEDLLKMYEGKFLTLEEENEGLQ